MNGTEQAPIGEVRYTVAGEAHVAYLHASEVWSSSTDPHTAEALTVIFAETYGGPSCGPFGPAVLLAAAEHLKGEAVLYPTPEPPPGLVY